MPKNDLSQTQFSGPGGRKDRIESGRLTIPEAFQCGECHRIHDTDSPEFREWAEENRGDLIKLLTPVGTPDTVLGCQCKQAQSIEDQRQTAATAERFALGNLPRRGDAIGPRIFKNFNQAAPDTEEMFGAIFQWADQAGGAPILTIVGVSGSGKSHLAEAAVAQFLDRGLSVRYERAEPLLNTLRRAFSADSEGDITAVMDWYDSFDALVLDDIGTNPSTPWGIGYMNLMIDKRYSEGRPLLVLTNIPDENEMADKWDERIADRLFDQNSGTVRVVWTTAKSYRTGAVVS